MSRHKAREVALKALFQIDVGRIPVERAIEAALAEEAPAPEAGGFARGLVMGTAERLAEIDGVLRQFSVGWSVPRMANIDRNILRLAVYEILHVPEIPASVSVNEAVELAKQYGDENSRRFINGILGNVVRSLRPEKV